MMSETFCMVEKVSNENSVSTILYDRWKNSSVPKKQDGDIQRKEVSDLRVHPLISTCGEVQYYLTQFLPTF